MVEQDKDRVEAEFREKLALIAAEELALSIVPLLKAVYDVGGMARAISILKAAREKK